MEELFDDNWATAACDTSITAVTVTSRESFICMFIQTPYFAKLVIAIEITPDIGKIQVIFHGMENTGQALAQINHKIVPFWKTRSNL